MPAPDIACGPAEGRSPTLQLRPTSSAMGKFVDVQGRRFGREQVLEIYLAPRILSKYPIPLDVRATAQANADGYFETTILLPRSTVARYCVFAGPKQDRRNSLMAGARLDLSGAG